MRTPRRRKCIVPPRRRPSEAQEQKKLAEYLDAVGVLWCHVPNERSEAVQARRLSGQGVKAGVPDVLIFERVYAKPSDLIYVGVAIELKRQRGPKGGKPGKVSERQRDWIDDLCARGWAARVCWGADEAIDWLEALGLQRSA